MVDNERGIESDTGRSEIEEEDDGMDGGLVGGGPRRTVSQDGIDEVFERLEGETADHGSSRGSADGVTASAEASTEGQTGAAASDGGDEDVGTLSGGGPTTTVSDDSVDDLLAQVGDDVGYATFDGVSGIEVDPDAVFPDDWDASERNGDGVAEEGAVPLPDEHTPPEDADDLRPDDADDAMVDLFADAAEEVGDSTPESVDGSDDEPDLAAEVDALLAAADEIDPATDGDTDPLADADLESDAPAESNADPDRGRSPLALNARDEAAVEWTEGGDVGVQASFPPESPRATTPDSPAVGRPLTAAESKADSQTREEGGADGRRSGIEYARSVVGWFRSVVARFV